MKICSRDWQDMLDVQRRIAVALEAISGALNDSDEVRAATQAIRAQTAKLQSALPTP